MTGLERIIQEIEKETSSKVNEILAKANEEAAKIIETAKNEAKKQADNIAESAELSEKDLIERSKSADELSVKKKILLKKQEIISDIIKEAEARLNKLSDAQYFDTILSMAKRFAADTPGEIIFSKKDKERMPSGFEDKLKSECASLTISDKTAKIDGGFILSYGGVEENCTFKALFESNMEELQDKVHTLLFE